MTCKHDGVDYCRRGFLKRNAGEQCRYYEKRKLYLCGRVTGDDNYRVKFLKAENKLYDAGFYPVNPAACIPACTEWHQAMREAIGLMLQCDGLALLPDWKKSKGAKIEVGLAQAIGIPVRAIHEWEKAAPV
jgi:nucleoside 2-deoxyribosyltransferase